MKKILLFVMLSTGLSTFGAVNYLNTPGTVWHLEERADSPPPFKYSYLDCILEEAITENGETVMALYQYYLHLLREPELVVYLKSEGDRVYFQQPSSTDWYLLYDFGMQEGDEEYFYEPSYNSSYDPNGPYLTKCVGRSEGTADEPAVLYMYDGDDEYPSPITTKWIEGVGSASGPAYNLDFLWLGWDISLLNVEDDGKIVYENKTSSVKEVATAENPRIRVQGNVIEVGNLNPGQSVNIYSADGKIVENYTQHTDNMVIEAPSKGLYIIKAGNTTRKIFVK